MSGYVFRAPFTNVKNAETAQLGDTENGDEPDRDPEHFVRWRSW